MKLLSTTLAALGPLFCCAQDWKEVWRANLLSDAIQTRAMADRGVKELNPLYRGPKEQIVPKMLLMGWAAERLARNEDDYRLLALVQIVVCANNGIRHKVGFPVLSIRF